MKRYRVPKNGATWPVRGYIDPSLRGSRAWESNVSAEWRWWAREELKARWEIVILTPCSNVKPYPRSPQSAKIRGVLKRLGLWNLEGAGYRGEPFKVDWIYLSDLLGLVPYTRALDYPACCYEFPPQSLDGNSEFVIREIRGVLEGFLSRNHGNIEVVIAYLPRFYRSLAKPVLERFKHNIRVIWVNFHLFYGHRRLEQTLREVFMV